MKKLRLFLLIGAIGFGSCDIDFGTDNSADSNSTSRTVYITESGSKYYIYNCSTIKNSTKISINISSAISQGYSACAVCNP